MASNIPPPAPPIPKSATPPKWGTLPAFLSKVSNPTITSIKSVSSNNTLSTMLPSSKTLLLSLTSSVNTESITEPITEPITESTLTATSTPSVTPVTSTASATPVTSTASAASAASATPVTSTASAASATPVTSTPVTSTASAASATPVTSTASVTPVTLFRSTSSASAAAARYLDSPVIIDKDRVFDEFNGDFGLNLYGIFKPIFDQFMHILFDDIINNPRTPFPVALTKKKKCKVVDTRLIVTRTIPEVPAIYTSGGNAYFAYNSLLNNRPYDTPLSVDYDVTFCVKDINPDNYIPYLQMLFITNFKLFNQQNLFTTYFTPISASNFPLEENETIISSLNSNFMLLTKHQHPSYNNISFRVTAKTKGGSLERLFDFIFTSDESDFQKVKYLNLVQIYEAHQLYHIVPDVDSLIKMNLKAIINRSISRKNYRKCTKDYYRLEKIFERLNRLNNTIKLNIGYTVDSYYKIFKYIISIVPHCTMLLDNTFIIRNYISKIPAFNKINELLTAILDKPSITEDELKRYDAEIIQNLESYNVREFVDIYRHKYEEYKKKYTELKQKRK